MRSGQKDMPCRKQSRLGCAITLKSSAIGEGLALRFKRINHDSASDTRMPTSAFCDEPRSAC